jgi:uncharacterized membrane protein YbhN (UPF0104 family)
MQLRGNQKRRIKFFISYFLGPLLFAWLSYSIYRQIKNQPDLEEKWSHIQNSFGGVAIASFITVFLLMLVNWGIEAYKWKLSVRKIQEIKFLTAFRAILSGTSFSVTTPNRVGEYLGRVLYMSEGNRLKAISTTIVGSLSQLLTTFFFGWIGLIVLKQKIITSGLLGEIWLNVLIIGVALVLFVLTVFYFRLPFLIRWIDRMPQSKKFAWLIQTLEEFNATLLLQLLSLSALRFMVFIVQYYILLRLFNVDVTLVQGFYSVSVAFLVMAVIPTIALFTDLGLRGEVNLKLMGLFSTNSLGISLTAISIWFINLILPALAGSLLILSIKRIFKNSGQPGGLPVKNDKSN